MIFEPTIIDAVVIVRASPVVDERGSFARLWDRERFSAAGLRAECDQLSLSVNRAAGTLRGFHFAAGRAEAKVVRALRGAIYDVAVDIRVNSPTFGRHVAVDLRAGDGVALYMGPGIAHGFQALADDTHVLYAIDVPYAAENARAIRFDDPAIGVAWPLPPIAVSARDLAAPLLADAFR